MKKFVLMALPLIALAQHFAGDIHRNAEAV